MATANCNGIEIEYEIKGEGEPLLLIMGIGGQLIHWPPGFITTLVNLGFKVIYFDNRDVGLSSKVRQGGIPNFRALYLKQILGLPCKAPYLLSDMANDAVALLDHLGFAQAHVAGMSMGGMIAQTMAIHHPQRLKTLTSIMSSPTGVFVSHPKALRMLMLRPPKNREEAMDRAVKVFRTLGSPEFPLDEQTLRQQAGLGFDRCVHPPGYARQLSAIIASGNRKKALAKVTTPTLVIHGSKDPLIPVSKGRATAKAVPDAQFKLVHGMGHSLPPGTWPILSQLILGHTITSHA